MILNVSGRTDIVAFFTPWFLKRLEAGFVDVRNPFYPKLVNRIYFHNVDAFVFCTKNPLPIIPHLAKISQPIIFEVTITPYQNDIERNVFNKDKIINSIQDIANIVGKDNVWIRYDPIFISKKYSLDYHIKAFSKLCFLLKNSTEHIIISFLDNYKNVNKNLPYIKPLPLSFKDYEKLGKSFFEVANRYGIKIQTCCEKVDLTQYGFIKNDCVSKEYIFALTGKKFPKWASRPCNCVQMVDIGAFNSCKHLCRYCYANYDEDFINTNVANHDPNSSLLIGSLQNDDIIKERKD